VEIEHVAVKHACGRKFFPLRGALKLKLHNYATVPPQEAELVMRRLQIPIEVIREVRDGTTSASRPQTETQPEMHFEHRFIHWLRFML
jgi:hypothetical protein